MKKKGSIGPADKCQIGDWFKQISRVAVKVAAITLSSVLLLSACDSKVAFKEEVTLGTGEVITVEREVEHAGGGAAWPQGQGTIPRTHLIRFRYPLQNGPVIEWKSTKRNIAGYSEIPLILDIEPDKSWIIYTALGLSVCDQYSKYQFKNGVWSEVPLSDDMETRETNLYLAAGSNSLKGLVNLGRKGIDNSSIGFRSRLKKVGPKRFACNTTYSGPYPPQGAQ